MPTSAFTSPPNPTFFNARVWELVQKIPSGKVATYGQIASWLPAPEGMAPADYKAFGARWVGGAMAACPDGVPWQRVVNAQGKISLRPGGGGARQRQLLEAEGVIFDSHDRIDLLRFGWSGPEQ
jgi:methylated-DNA-protein-cysteine methyltransferase-like protein